MTAVAPFERLDRAAAAGARFVVEMGRAADSGFHLRAHALTAGETPPDRAELLPLVPPGSRWFPAVGWDAYFGWPLRAGGRRLWALGATCVQPRAGGGAYPIVRVHLHDGPAPPFAALEALATALDPTPRELHPAAPEGRFATRALPGRAPDESRGEQAAVVGQALAACRAGRAPLFRTAVLAEAELLPLVRLPRRFPPGIDQCLIGVPSALARGFSTKAQLLLDLRRLWPSL